MHVTELGITMFVNALQSIKAFVPMEQTPLFISTLIISLRYDSQGIDEI